MRELVIFGGAGVILVIVRGLLAVLNRWADKPRPLDYP